MHLPSDFLHQLVSDREQELLEPAAAHRLTGSAPARRRVAQFLRRAADRLDAATAAPGRLDALPARR